MLDFGHPSDVATRSVHADENSVSATKLYALVNRTNAVGGVNAELQSQALVGGSGPAKSNGIV